MEFALRALDFDFELVSFFLSFFWGGGKGARSFERFCRLCNLIKEIDRYLKLQSVTEALDEIDLKVSFPSFLIRNN